MTGRTVDHPHRWVDNPADLATLIDELRDEPRLALDTEFHRERTYFPHVALVQIAWSGGTVLVDPLNLDLSPLADLLVSDIVWVLHAAQQDLEVLQRACGTVPSHLFDTQLGAGFVGYSTPSLATLVSAELGIQVGKADRLTDWLHRPLTVDQRNYAASDVAYLLALHDTLVEQLTKRDRLQWALDECEQMRTRSFGPSDPESAWLKLKDSRSLRGTARGVAQCVSAWRERRAAAIDQPSRFVLADMAILGLAQRPPKNLDDLRKVRGIDDRAARGALGEELLAAVAKGLTMDVEDLRLPASDDIDKRLRPAVTLVSAWVSQLARDEEVDTVLLATRNDLVELLRGDPEARLAVGWRADMIGERVRDLVSGKAALAFDGRGNLVLEPRYRSEPAS
ncbi:MAG: ribonuclease D [Acidimicrobiia bacterium]